MLDIFLLRDVFKSLKCCLALWLSSMLDCINLYVFHFLEKLFSFLASRQLPWSIKLPSWWTPLGRSLTALRQLNTFLMLVTSRHISICRELWSFYIKDWWDFSLTFLDLSRSFLTSHLPQHLSFTPNLFPTPSLVLILHFS